MAGEIIKTRGIVLSIHPWSRTSHIVSWLTPDNGVVATHVKGAVRPKSAFLGQYDLFYACDLLYYAHAKGELHALREVAPLKFRERLRGSWRETCLAGYATDLVRSMVASGSDSQEWYDFLDNFLETLDGTTASLVRLEMEVLKLGGLAPDFSALDPTAAWVPFSIDSGRIGSFGRVVRLSPRTVNALRRPDSSSTQSDAIADAVRFLGQFLPFHVERPPEIRRSLITVLSIN